MLPVQPYHEGSYPPGAKFPQFGDDVIGGYLNAHAALAEKRRNMVPFHIGRLQQDGLVPLNHMETQTPAPRPDPEGELIDGGPPAPPPLPPRGRRRMQEPERERPTIRYGEPVTISEPVPGPQQHYIGSDGEGAMGAPTPGLPSAIASGLGSAALSVGAGAGRLAWRGLKAGTSAAFRLATAGNHAAIPEEDRPQEPWYERPSPPSPSGSPQAPRGGHWFYPGRSANPPPHFVDASSWNGTGAHAITISDDEEDEPPGAAAAARRPRRPVRRSDEQLARDTLAGLGPNVGRGMRRRGA